MPNYYELLQVQPTATTGEIGSALDTQYNQWRRLVTHHDPNVVNQANQALASLQTIREVLTDPSKRSIYDAGIGISGAIGGLADPSAVLRMAPPPPPPPAPRTAQAPVQTPAPVQRVDVWTCPKCHTVNPIGSRYCKGCATQIGMDCPNCGKLIDATAVFCPECSANIRETIQSKFYAQQQKRIQEVQDQIDVETRKINELASLEGNTSFAIGTRKGDVRKNLMSAARSGKGAVAIYTFAWIGVALLLISQSCRIAESLDTLLCLWFLFIAGGAIGLNIVQYVSVLKPEIQRRIDASRNTISELERQVRIIGAEKLDR